MKNTYIKYMHELVKNDHRVVVLGADAQDLHRSIHSEFPRQYIEYGIAESNMVASAAGFATCGMIPFVFGLTNFIAMRAFEFIRDDICIPCKNVKILGAGAGLERRGWGPTHHGTEDLAILRALPNLLVITPSTPIGVHEAMKYAYLHDGPVYIRLEGLGEPEVYDESFRFHPGEGYMIHEGRDITLIAMGSIVSVVLDAAKTLELSGVSVRVIDMPTSKPIDENMIVTSAADTRGIITVEEHTIYGGLGSAVAEVLAEHGSGTAFRRLGLTHFVQECGNREELRASCCIGTQNIIDNVKQMLLPDK